jgi:hypothetical protein
MPTLEDRWIIGFLVAVAAWGMFGLPFIYLNWDWLNESFTYRSWETPVDWIDRHHDVIIAASTFVIGFFTFTLWRVNRKQLKHTREIERAYLVGGGGVTKEAPHTFVLDVANYGKTPASVKAFAVEICPIKELPSKPKYLELLYKRKIFVDEIAPGQRKAIWTKPVSVPDVENPIIYGRFWFKDIWKQDRYFSFILAVKEREGVGFGTHPDIDLVGIDPEYTAWK